jgi:hypothetical protein
MKLFESRIVIQIDSEVDLYSDLAVNVMPAKENPIQMSKQGLQIVTLLRRCCLLVLDTTFEINKGGVNRNKNAMKDDNCV